MGRDVLDFDPKGQGGFYVTTIREQAEDWYYRKLKWDSGVSLYKFEVPNSELAKLNIKYIDLNTHSGMQEWSDIVTKGRQGTLIYDQPYDGVDGPMLGNPKSVLKGKKPRLVEGGSHQLALFSQQGAEMFDRHLVSVTKLPVDECE
ncbi:hypothetical protein Xsto_02446 [Xenorhabdus stockiae]|uniref:Uncharacterized protein n=1 Tax=Xenorhabdus stockiae TaxID=351614 RepID=A0A2D0KNG8_9GAMM|nr:hypothetical protein Xsto_02446 [Xenorhabdus stockiae]